MASIERIVYTPGWQRQLEDIGEAALDEFGDMIVAAAKVAMPASTDGSYGRQPGYARSRMRTLERGRDFSPYRHIGTDATTPEGVSYPAIVHYGSRPHVIESHGPWPLRDPRTGRVFGRRVMHPGTKPNPWGARAVRVINGRTIRL